MALTDKLTNIANAIREKTGSTRTMNLEGMAAAVTNIKIPTALSDLNEDETHRTVTDAEKKTWNNKSNFSGNYDDLKNKPTIPTIPEKLPNPNPLTFTGAVEGSYDGSAPLNVEIPSGGGAAVETWDLLINAEIAEDCTEVTFNSGDAGEVLSDYKELLVLIDLFGNTGGFTTALKIGFLNNVLTWNSPYALNMVGYSVDTVKYYINMFRFKKTEYGILPVNRYTQYNSVSMSNGLYNTGSINSAAPATDFTLPISAKQHVTTGMTDFTSQKDFERLGIAGYQAVIGAGTIIKVWGMK